MPADFSDVQREIERLSARSQSLARALHAAQRTVVTATSADGQVEASAAGLRLTQLSIDTAARLGHDALVQSMLEAAQLALRESARVLSEAASTVLPVEP